MSFFGCPVSIPTVVGLCKNLNYELNSWREKHLHEAYPYIIIHSRYVKTRLNNRFIVDQELLIVAGIDEHGNRCILDFMLTDLESEVILRSLFNKLKNQGLNGVKLVVSDSHRGIVNAIRHCLKGALWQRCQACFIREALTKLSGKKEYQILTEILKEIFYASDKEKAFGYKKNLLDRLNEENPDLSVWLDKNVDDSLTVFNFPKNHRKRLKTTNMLVPLLREIRKRTRLIKIFPCMESSERVICALVIDQDEEWMTRRKYLNMEELNQ